ncbi:MAG: hypothetical protein ACOCX3_01980 [Chloroflexota bacterium]
MINPWTNLQPIFDIPDEIYPEIDIVNLSNAAMHQVVHYLIHNMRGLSTEFHTFVSEDPVFVKSPGEMINRVTRGDLIGTIAGELKVARYTLPEIVYIFEEPGVIIMSYGTGRQWTPLKVIALFEWFRMVNTIDASTTIQLSKHFFSPGWMRTFDSMLRTYLNEQH